MATLTYTAGLPSNSEQWFVLHIIFGCYHFASASRVAFSIFLLTQLWYQFISSYGVVLGSFLVTQVVRLVFLPLPGFHLHLYLRLLLRYLHHFHLDLPAERVKSTLRSFESISVLVKSLNVTFAVTLCNVLSLIVVSSPSTPPEP